MPIQLEMALIVLFLFTNVDFGWTQVIGAQVAENRVSQVIYVNVQHPQASDSNPGTTTLPFKTLEAAAAVALENNKQNIGTKILIYPGTYRESLELRFARQVTDAPIIFEAQTPGQAVISGSDVWTDWTRQNTTDIYLSAWPYRWGMEPIPKGWEKQNLQPIVRRREMIFVNGTPLEQGLSLQDLQAKEGTFYIVEEDRLVYTRMPSGVNRENATVEVAVRPQLFKIDSAKNIVLRGLVFQHANSPIEGSAVSIVDSSNILIDGCNFRWNNWTGLKFWHSTDVTVKRNIANHNGATGMTPVKMRNVLFEDNETSYNNWRGAQGGFYSWATAGIKNLFIHDGIYLRHRSIGNQTNGFWCDTDCINVVLSEVRLCNNLMEGLFIEVAPGPITMKNSIVCNNQRFFGIRILGSSNITLESNVIYGNKGAQIGVDNVFDRPVKNWETEEKMMVKAEKLTLKGNIIVGKNANQLVLNMPSWSHLLDSFTSAGNLWFNPERKNPFIIDSNRLDLRGWQVTTNQDLNSMFTDPRFIDPSNCSFALFPDSPLLGKPFLTPSAASRGWAVSAQ
jgi:hypothetical protein